MAARPQTPPDPKPRLFISAVSKEFGELRRRTDEWVRRLGCEPETMEVWGTEPGDLRALLREKIDACKGLIQIVGDGYGAEPPTPDPDFGRVSYTQYEFLYAQSQGKTTWLFPSGAGALCRTPAAELDLPPPGDPGDPAAYQAERRALQAAYRERLRATGHLRHGFGTAQDLQLLIQDLRGQTQAWHAEYRESQRRLHRRLGRILAGVLALAVLVVGSAWWLHRQVTGHQDQSAATLERELTDLDTQKALAQARAGRDYQGELARASALPAADQRQAALARLEAEHRYRLEAIDRLFETLRHGYSQGEIDAITREFQAILNEPAPRGGIDPALAYLQGQVPGVLAEYRRLMARRDEAERQARAALRSLLIAAESAAAEGRPAQAAALYDQTLETAPDWPEALASAAWFYQERAEFEREHGTLAAALPLARKALTQAERLAAHPPVDTGHERLLAVAQLQLADCLALRGQPGDADSVADLYRRASETLERLLAANPDSAEAARDLMVSHERMSKGLAAGTDGAAPVRALEHQRKALEIGTRLYDRNPGSRYLARTVAVSYFLTAQRALTAADPELAARALADCHAVLHRSISAGMAFDAPIMGLYAQLREALGDGK